MSINNCCCGETTVPPPPGITAEPSCALSETIMSQTGLITDLNCGIKPVIGEILGVQMQSTAITVDSVPAPNLFATSAKNTFVFGYALSRNVSEVTSTEGDEERFVATPYPQLLSPIEGTIPCYWVWWTKNRSLELDIKFPNNNFSGCIEQDYKYYYANGGYWCTAFATNSGLQGAYSHDGNSCWRGSQWAPSDLTNLYSETLDSGTQYTDYRHVDEIDGGNSIDPQSGTESGRHAFCCSGWGHSNCSPSDWQRFGVNEVGSYHNEGNGGQEYYSSYKINKDSQHNVKYPASTVQERLASIVTGAASCYYHVDHPLQLHNCWRNDKSNPRDYDLSTGNDGVGFNCKDVVVNGLTPYQRRVSQERSPDIWEIHEFNDSLPIKIKVQDISIDRPAIVKIWGKDSLSMTNALRDQEDGLVKYTDLSCGGNNISLVRQNAEPRVYTINNSTDQIMVSPTKSRKTIIITNQGSVIPTSILQGAEMLYKVNNNWYIGGGGGLQNQYPSENFIKKVSTGYNHVICTRDNYTAEVSETTVNTSGTRQYYSSSIPTAIEINSQFDYNQIDIPYSPGSKRFKYDWVTHDCTGNGCTSCMNPLFDIKDLTVGPANLLNSNCDSGLVPIVDDVIKVASGSCRFTKTNPTAVEIDCRNYTPWCAPCWTSPSQPPCPDCPANMCYPGNPPSFGTLSCQGSNNNWITPQKTSSCLANPTPFCDSGYPPITCKTVNNWYICGTGGFNSTLHEYADYRAYTCGRDITNYDKNYCEGIQAWDSISAGGYHNVAINKHSTFKQPKDPLCTCPLPETNVYPFGEAYNPGNNVVAWGAGEENTTPAIWPNFGQSIVPDIGHCKKVSAGRYHSLAIDKNNKIHAWGAGGVGALGCPAQGDPLDRHPHFGQSIISDAIKDIEFIEISAGQFHSCGIRKDNGRVMCWGAGTVAEPNGGVCQANWGQSIVGITLGKCTSISAGGFHTCAITELGTVKCWGKNVDKQCEPPTLPCVQISCGLNFSAGRFVEDIYETFPYWNASNQRSTPAIDPAGGFWPMSLFRYFFAFASMEFTYGRGVSPETPGICDVDWGRSLPKAYHQRSDAVHIFAFETEIYNGNDSKLAEQLMEEDLSLYVYQGEPIQVSWGHMGDGYSAVEPGWKSNCDNVNRNLSSPYYWADRMSCKDWRQEIWDDLQIIKGAVGSFGDWPDLDDLSSKYTSPGDIKPVGAYRIRGDKFDIRDARNPTVNTNKRPPELAKMACTSEDLNPTFKNLNCVGRVAIPEEYKDTTDNGKYTLQVNKDIYNLVKPVSIFLNREQLDAYNRLTLSVYFRPKPIGWDYSGPDWLFSDWPTPEISEITGGARSWRYGWLQSDRRKTRPRAVTDKSSSLVSTGIGTNNIVGKSVQGQPFWDTYNRGPVVTKISSTLALTVSCDYIGPQVAYTYNAHIYTARHIPGINTKGGVIKQNNQGIAYPMQYEPKYYTCQLFNIT